MNIPVSVGIVLCTLDIRIASLSAALMYLPENIYVKPTPQILNFIFSSKKLFKKKKKTIKKLFKFKKKKKKKNYILINTRWVSLANT